MDRWMDAQTETEGGGYGGRVLVWVWLCVRTGVLLESLCDAAPCCSRGGACWVVFALPERVACT